jgi:ribosomal protein S18 acetylase RimI-like enzyme
MTDIIHKINKTIGESEMITKINLNDIETVKEILELQRASYIIEAELMDFYEIPPLRDTEDSLKTCGENFYGYYSNDVLAGIISYKVIDHLLDIHRVAIHPNFFRMGIAGKLINLMETLEQDIDEVEVCTGKKNIPAINLYIKNGYKRIKDIEIKDGVFLTMFHKEL